MNASTNIELAAGLEFEMLTTHVDDLEQMSYTTYGIRVKDKNGNVVLEHTDISTSKEFVRGFLDMVEGHDISPLHIGDILDDYLL